MKNVIDRVSALAHRRTWVVGGVAVAAVVGLSAGAWGTSSPSVGSKATLPGVAAAAVPVSSGKTGAACRPGKATGKTSAKASVKGVAAGKKSPGTLLAKATDYCGDGTCDTSTENCSSCESDCGRCCPNGSCEPEFGEDCNNCSDCQTTCCINGVCEDGENRDNCPLDCGYCGDGRCDGGENRDSCPQDCGYCGDGWCDGNHEACNSCPEDCGHRCCNNNLRCFPSQEECEAVCCGSCERRINCGGPSAYKCFE